MPRTSTQGYADALACLGADGGLGTPHDPGSAGLVVGHPGDIGADLSFGNTGKKVGIDTVKWSVRAARIGRADMMQGFFRLSDSITGWMSPEHGYVTFSGSLPKHFGLSGGAPLPTDEIAAACSVVVAQAQDDGWLLPAGGLPWSGRFLRLDLVHDLRCGDRAGAMDAAFPRLKVPANEVPVRVGRPTQTVSIHMRKRKTGKLGRVTHRVYDKGAELGEAHVETLRLEVQLSAYRLKKCGYRDLTGDVDAAVGEAWSVLQKYGWWEALDGRIAA